MNKFRILFGRMNFKGTVVLFAFFCFLSFSLPSFAHKSILVNTRQAVIIHKTSIKISHVIDCGTKSPLNILPLLDEDKNGKIGDNDIKALTNRLKDAFIKRQSSYQALLDGQTVLIPLQELTIHYDQTEENTTVEITFYKQGISFKDGPHKLVLEREGFRSDIPLLVAWLAYPSTPEQGHGVPAHLVRMSLHFPSNFKIQNSNLGFTSPDFPSLLKGVFLTMKEPKLEVDFEVSPHIFPNN